MKVFKEGNDLCIRGGFFQGLTRIPLDRLKSWSFCREENGASYLAFVLDGATQHVAFPACKAPEVLSQLQQIQAITGLAPGFDIEQDIGSDVLLVSGVLTLDVVLLLLGTQR